MKKQDNPNSQRKSVQIKNQEVLASDNLEENFLTIDNLFGQIKKKQQFNEDIKIIKENAYGLFLEINAKYFKVIDFDRTMLGYQQHLSDITQSFLKALNQNGCNITNYKETFYEVDSKSCLHLEREFQLIEILEFQGDIEKAINETETFEWIGLYDKAKQYWISQNNTENQKSIANFQRAFHQIENVKEQYRDYKFIQINLNCRHFTANEIQTKVIAYTISLFNNIKALELKGEYQQIIGGLLNIIYPINNLEQISLCITQHFQSEKLEPNLDQLVQFIDKQNKLIELTLIIYTQTPQFITDFANCLKTKTCLKTLKFELLKSKYQFYKDNQAIDLTEYCTQIVQNVYNLNHLNVLNLKINLNSNSTKILAEQLKYLKDLVFIQFKFNEITIQEDEQESLIRKLFNSMQTLKKLNYLKLSFNQNNKQENLFNDLGNELCQMKQVKYLTLHFVSLRFLQDSFTSSFFNNLSTNTSIENLKIKIIGEFQQESLFHLANSLKNLSHLCQLKTQINKYLGPISKVKKAQSMIRKLKRLTNLRFTVVDTAVNWFQY
ncbi:hypothetical protein ABPG72_020425 [Tetrahymena utriculariae]